MGKINPFIFNIAKTKLYYQNIAKVERNAKKMGMHMLGAMPRRIKKRCRADILWRLIWRLMCDGGKAANGCGMGGNMAAWFVSGKMNRFYSPKEAFSLNAANSFIFAA